MKRATLFTLLSVAFIVNACGILNSGEGDGFNLFTIEDDKALGAQVAAEIEANPTEYPILDSASNPEIYQYVYKVRDKILNTGQVSHKDDFTWRLRVIHDDSTLNAFCTPGGYIYIYTGILKFLDSEDQFAGVMGHEIAHADKRHSTKQMTKMFGIQLMLDIVAGDRAAIKQVTGAIIGLKFSRNHETEADEKSVDYLCPTDYNAAGGAGFFRKIEEMGGGRVPEFLSTHPDPGDRIEKFELNAQTKGCQGKNTFQSEYNEMKTKLP